MTKPKFKNDTSLTRLGDQYQYLIALECCINATSDSHIIYIEQRGDVATEDESTEVKHHSDENHKISDRHTDFWKTLKNWVENYETISSYKKLILLTTSNIQEKSKLVDWNTLTRESKLEQITKIKDNKITDTIKDFVEVVFNYTGNHSEERLLEILAKFCISHNQPVIADKVAELLKHSFFKTIPSRNRKPFLNLLLGYISAAGRENAENWQIKMSEFNNFVEYNSKNYTSDTLPIPDSYRDIKAEINEFDDFNFVKELRNIELEDQLQNAVNDYYRTQKTALLLTENDIFFADNLSHYQDNVITTDLKLIKDKCGLEIVDKTDSAQKIKQSKNSYYGAMQLPIKDIKGYEDNPDFFQRGTIHTIVDSKDSDFSWIFDD